MLAHVRISLTFQRRSSVYLSSLWISLLKSIFTCKLPCRPLWTIPSLKQSTFLAMRGQRILPLRTCRHGNKTARVSQYMFLDPVNKRFFKHTKKPLMTCVKWSRPQHPKHTFLSGSRNLTPWNQYTLTAPKNRVRATCRVSHLV